MGYAARANKRSPDGGKPRAYTALYRLGRAVEFFQGDKVQFDLWLDRTNATPEHRAQMNHLWEMRHQTPLVVLAS